MNYPVPTSQQLRAVLVAMRKARALSQAQVGQLLGVNQKPRGADRERSGRDLVRQISRLVAALGGRLVIEMRDLSPAEAPKKGAKKAGCVSSAGADQGHW